MRNSSGNRHHLEHLLDDLLRRDLFRLRLPSCPNAPPLRGVGLPLTRALSEWGRPVAATTAPAGDARARETLCKYVLRPPLAQDRVRRLGSGLVPPFGDAPPGTFKDRREARRILIKRPFPDCATAIDLDPLSLLCRLAAAVPPPRAHRVNYAGVLAAAHRWRARVVPPLPQGTEEACTLPDGHAHAAGHDADGGHGDDDHDVDRPATHRSRYRPWRELLKRTFEIDVETCAKCGDPGESLTRDAPMALRATRFVTILGQ